MTARMTSVFNGRWPEMSSFNIFIKTSHFDPYFGERGFKQTNKPLQFTEIQFLLTAAAVHKYQLYALRKRRTHTCREHAQNTQVHSRYTETEFKGGMDL